MRTSLVLTLMLFAASAHAGPPAVCWPVEIGDAACIEWNDWGNKAEVDRSDVLRAALRRLDAKTPVIVRMETIRRVTITVHDDRALRSRLLLALQSRVLDAEAEGRAAPLAWFDAGYAVGCLRQLGSSNRRSGYAWVRKAIRLSGGNPDMEYACAVLTLMGSSEGHENFESHLDRAKDGAKKGTLLARNLSAFAKLHPPVLRYFREREAREREAKERKEK